MFTVPVPAAVIFVPESAVTTGTVVTTPVLGGLVTVICVLESAVIVPAALPKRTTVASARPVPVMVTVFPPAVLPLAGDTPVTAGSVTACEADLVKPIATTVPATAITTAITAAMAFLAALVCRSRERQRCRCRRIFSTVVPWTAACPPDGHRAASSSAASARWERPRSCQRGP